MSALASVQGYSVSYVPPTWGLDNQAYALRLVPRLSLPVPHGKPAQRSLPLFRVVRLHLSVTAEADIAIRPPPAQENLTLNAFEQPAPSAPDTSADCSVEFTPTTRAPPRRWSDANVVVLKADYPTPRPVRDIGAELGRSVSAIYGKARRLKLKRPQRGTAPLPSAAPLPDLFMTPAAEIAEQAALPPPIAKPPPSRKQVTKRTKLGGREGRWVRNDGALSVRMERLHLAGFHDKVIAAVLGLTSAAVLTRAWAINCPEREAAGLRYDVETARLVDRQAAPLPKTVVSRRWQEDADPQALQPERRLLLGREQEPLLQRRPAPAITSPR